jgi:hypothetical protein
MKMEIPQNEKCPDTGKVEGAAQMSEQPHHTNHTTRLSMAEKMLVCFCTGYGLLLILWLAAIRLGVIHG